MKAYLIASIGALVLAMGIAYAAPNTGSGSTSKANCPPKTCGPNHPITHGHHAKIKPGQKNESSDPNKWPGPHPGIGGGFHAQQQTLPAGQRTSQ